MFEFLFSRFSIRRLFWGAGAAAVSLLAASGGLAVYLFLYSPGAAVFAALVAALLLSAVLVLILLFGAQKKLLLPVRTLAGDMESIAKGRPAEKRVFYDDEIGFLTEQFYAMKTRMEQDYRDLEKISFTDALTGLYNRHYFFQTARQQAQIAARNGHPSCILIGDLDHFKSINDTHGHVHGDGALKHAAKVVRGGVRESDICARFGGEEFIIWLNNANLEIGAALGDKIRAAMEQAPYRADSLALPLTISIGVAEVAPKEGGVSDAINAADNALYEAKNAGRNVVRTAETKD